MVVHSQISDSYVPLGNFRVWSKGSGTFDTNRPQKESNPNSARQRQFEAELLRLARVFGGAHVPVFVQWSDTGPRRMDMGCVGHAVASGFLSALRNGAAGYVTHVQILSERLIP